MSTEKSNQSLKSFLSCDTKIILSICRRESLQRNDLGVGLPVRLLEKQDNREIMVQVGVAENVWGI